MRMQKTANNVYPLFITDNIPLLDNEFDKGMEDNDNLHFLGSAEILGLHGSEHDEDEEELLALAM